MGCAHVVGWERGQESNLLPTAYEAAELPLLHPAFGCASWCAVRPKGAKESAHSLNDAL